MTQKSLTATRYSIELAVGSQIERLPIVFCKRSGARHMVIRYQPLQHIVSVTLPRYVSIRQGLLFVEEKRNWIASRLREHELRVPFSDGQEIPLMGRRYRLCHVGGRGVVAMEGDRIIVPGEESFMARRVREWIKRIAREEIIRLSQDKAKQLGCAVKKISLRDTSSRWGSCSHDGNLSFSWRLVFAPHEVLEYVVSHEVAHLKQHNHSPAFWKLVAELCPAHDTARAWLGAHGPELYAYG